VADSVFRVADLFVKLHSEIRGPMAPSHFRPLACGRYHHRLTARKLKISIGPAIRDFVSIALGIKP
jgi:hypothetical protein